MPNVSRAARVAGISRAYAYRCKEADPSFSEEWEDALKEGVEELEAECWKRAKGENITYKFKKNGDPILHPVTGEPYYEHVASDTMAALMLKAHAPDKYKDRSEVTGANGTPLIPQYDPAELAKKLSPDQLAALRAAHTALNG